MQEKEGSSIYMPDLSNEKRKFQSMRYVDIVFYSQSSLVLDELDMCYSSTLYEFDMYYNSALYKSDMCYSSALYELDMCNSSTICGLKYVKGNGGRGVKEKDGVAQSAKENSETGTQEANSIKADHINLHDENVGKHKRPWPVILLGKYRPVRSMLNSSTRIFSFQFSSIDGLDALLENGVWFIRNNPLINEDVGNVLVWVNLYGVPITAFSKDGLSAIATKHGSPLMLDSYTSDMCNQSWSRSSYARAMIEVRADVKLKDTILADMPKLTGEGFSTCNFHDECSKNIDSGMAKNMKKPSQAPRGVLVGPKVGFKPTKQTFRVLPKQTNANTSGDKKKDVIQAHLINLSTIPIVEKFDKIEKLIIYGQVTLVDDDGKPVEKVDYLGDHDGEDDVASTANDM
ncbi:putative reverse transcriptase domain-containing protein [Tanacetum coccineum]